MNAYIIWDVSPEIFDGFIFFRWYGVSWLLGMVLGYTILLNLYKAEGIPLIELDRLSAYLVVGAVLGARLGHILFYDPTYYWNNPMEILPFKIEPSFEFTGLAGLASHGGIVGALMALYFYDRNLKRGYLWLLDRITVGGAALGGFIRLGNVMNSEIVGTPSDLPWAFVFKRIDDVPRHPAQLYEAIFYFGIAIALYVLMRTKKLDQRDGFIFGLGIAAIFMVRFLIECIKENQVSFEGKLSLNMGQMLSIPFIIAGLALMVWSSSRKPVKSSD
jgi:phosphatidylglycerol---prolipoprotein diacylglyceryl transferase